MSEIDSSIQNEYHETKKIGTQPIGDVTSMDRVQDLSQITNGILDSDNLHNVESFNIKDNYVSNNKSNLENLINNSFSSIEQKVKNIEDLLKNQVASKNIALATAEVKAKELQKQLDNYQDYEECKKKSLLYDELYSNLKDIIINLSQDIPKMFDNNNEKLLRLHDSLVVVNQNIKALIDSESKKNDLEKQNLEEKNKDLSKKITELDILREQLQQQNIELRKAKSDIQQDLEKNQESLYKKEEEYLVLKNEYNKSIATLEEKKEYCIKLDSLCSDSKSQNVELMSNIEKLKSDNSILQEEKDKISIELNNYRALEIDNLKEAYGLLMNFTKQTRDNLKSVFPTDTFLGFISDGMQWERIAGIWEQTKRMIINDSLEDVNNMKRLFNILFEIYNEGYIEKPYVLIIPKVGAKYDINEQVIKNSKPDGIISEVLLEGYISTKNNAVHKAVVTVE